MSSQREGLHIMHGHDHDAALKNYISNEGSCLGRLQRQACQIMVCLRQKGRSIRDLC